MVFVPRKTTDKLTELVTMPGASKTTRLRKLVCSDDCGYPPLRASRAAIAKGLPRCVCGAVFWPWDLDDIELARSAGHLSDEQYASHPLVREFQRQWASVTQGQKGHANRGHKLESPDVLAALRVAQSVREDNRAAQLRAARALAPAPEPMPF